LNYSDFPFAQNVAQVALVFSSVETRGRVGNAASETRAGVEILTPTGGVNFNGYLQGLFISVKQNWFAKMPEEARRGTKGRVVIRFQVKKDGSLVEGFQMLESSSGSKDLDNAALSAIKSAAPFKRLPDEFTGPRIDLRFTFNYNLPIE